MNRFLLNLILSFSILFMFWGIQGVAPNAYEHIRGFAVGWLASDIGIFLSKKLFPTLE